MRRVLIIRSGAVGDLILTLPVLTALKARYPDITIDMMGSLNRLLLLTHCGLVNKTWDLDSRDLTPLFGRLDAISSSTVCELSAYDAIISYLPKGDGLFMHNLRKIAKGPVYQGSPDPDQEVSRKERKHMTHVLMEVLAPLGISSRAEAPKLPVAPAAVPCVSASNAKARASPTFNPAVAPESERQNDSEPSRSAVQQVSRIIVHPGSGGEQKCWPGERFATLINTLGESGYSAWISFGPADRKIRDCMLPRIQHKHPNVRIVEHRALPQMAELLSQCKVMIGNDSGITHLAAAAGTQVIALFGPTDPALWGPRSKQAQVIWGGESMEGDAGSKKWIGPYHPRKLEDISVDSVLKAVEKSFSRA